MKNDFSPIRRQLLETRPGRAKEFFGFTIVRSDANDFKVYGDQTIFDLDEMEEILLDVAEYHRKQYAA